MQRLGLSLKNFYEEIKLNLHLRDIIKIGISLLKQIKEVHNAGYLHCDIKPDNIMLANYNGLIKHLID